MEQGRVQRAHVEQMSRRPLRAGMMATQALPGRAHQVQVSHHLSREVRDAQSIILIATL